ncbi:MAG: DinB family protein [Candidatus Heimdallarchaeaceae archaeon]
MRQKVSIYLDLINSAHSTFQDFLQHLPDEILDLRLNTLVPTARQIIKHTISDQLWLASFITGEQLERPVLQLDNNLTLVEYLSAFEKVATQVIERFSSLTDDILEQKLDFKGCSRPIKEWLFEYIHHLSFHSGQLSQIHVIWKRMPDDKKIKG